MAALFVIITTEASWRRPNANGFTSTWDRRQSRDITLTTDGMAMRIITITPGKQGVVLNTWYVERRVSGGTSLAGVWRSTNAGVNATTEFVIEDAGTGTWKIAYPNEGQFFVVRTDSRPAPLQGPHSVRV